MSVRTPLKSECSFMGLGIWVANVGSTAIHRTQAYSVKLKDLYLCVSVCVCGLSKRELSTNYTSACINNINIKA